MNGRRAGTRSAYRVPNQRTISADGSLGRLDRQPAVGRRRRHRLGLERRAREELPQRRLQQAVVERADGEGGRKADMASIHIIIHGMRAATRCSTSSRDLVRHPRRVPRLRRRLPDAGRTRYARGRRARARGFAARLRRRRARQGRHRSSSGARTGPNGSPRSGAACSPASSSSRSTTARRPTSSQRVAAHRRRARGRWSATTSSPADDRRRRAPVLARCRELATGSRA